MQGTRNLARTCRGPTPHARTHHARYRDKEIQRTIPLGARCKQRELFARTCGERHPHENIQQAIPVGPSVRHATSQSRTRVTGKYVQSFPHKSSKERYPWSGCHCGKQGRVIPTCDTVGPPDRYSQVKKKTTRKSEGWYVNPLLHTSGSRRSHDLPSHLLLDDTRWSARQVDY